MNSSTKTAILLSFLSLYCAKYFSIENQQIISFVGITLLGIIHGANDIAILTTFSGESKSRLQPVLRNYIFSVAGGFMLFYLFPLLTLITFLLISGFHFGNQHWGILNTHSNKVVIYLFQTLYGLFVMGLLFSVHPAEVNKIIAFLLNKRIPVIPFSTCTIVVGVFLVLVGLYMNSLLAIFKKHIVVNLFYLLLFSIIFLNSGLIWGFGIYFILWHSLPSMHDQMQYLFGATNKSSWVAYFKSGFIFWLVPSIGVFMLYFLVPNDITFKALFFSLIAAVTFPHAYVISKMQAAAQRG